MSISKAAAKESTPLKGVEISARLASAEELQMLVKVLHANAARACTVMPLPVI
jgi:hypothetical protein